MLKSIRERAASLRRLVRDERGMAFPQLVAIIVGPIILGLIALGGVSALRLGGDLTGAFTRDTQMTQMVERMQVQLSGATGIDVRDAEAFTLYEQPSRRTAYTLPSDRSIETCVTSRWEFVDAGATTTLANTRTIHETDSCESPVLDENEWTLTGFQPGSGWRYENAYGRDLTFDGGVEEGTSASVNERPAGLFDNEWGFPEPGLITFDADLNQVLGSSPIVASATTSFKQLRPGVVVSDLGELGPPKVTMSDRGDNEYRFTFTADMNLDDPRATIMWRYRWALNHGETVEAVPAAAADWVQDGADWTAWTGLDYHDQRILQGEKFQIEVQYRVVLGNEQVESEQLLHQWVRPIAKPAAPAAPQVSLATPTGTSSTATLTGVPSACPDARIPMLAVMQLPDRVNEKVRYTLASDAVAGDPKALSSPYRRVTQAVLEGQLLEAAAHTQCYTRYIASPWSDGSRTSSVTKTIVTKPTIESVTGALSGAKSSPTAVISGCPSHLTYEWRTAYRKNAKTSDWDAWSDWFAAKKGTNTRVGHQGVKEGERIQVGVRARCVSPWTAGDYAGKSQTDWKIRPITDRVGLDSRGFQAYDMNGVGRGQGWLGGDVCASHMTIQHRFMYGRGATVGNGWNWQGGFGTQSRGTSPGSQVWFDANITLHEGEIFVAGVDLRCATAYATGPGTHFAGTHTRPIGSTPGWTRDVWLDGGNVYGRGWNMGCPGGTSGQWRAYGPNGWTAWRGNGSAAASVGWLNEGAGVTAQVQGRCVSSWAQGPAVGYSEWLYRPVPVPPTPGRAWNVSGGVTRACDNSYFINRVQWDGASYATGYRYYSTYNNALGNRGTTGTGTTTGTGPVNAGASVAVSASVQAEGFIQAYNGTGASGWRSTGRLPTLPTCMG